MNEFSQFFVKQGFIKINNINVYQSSNFFIKSVNIQRKTTGDKYFINLGVSPIIPNLSPFSNKEIDALIRFRIHPQDGFSIDTIHDYHFIETLFKTKITDYFDHFSSVDEIFSPITPIMIEKALLPTYLTHTITQTSLSHICAKYWLAKNDIDKAKAFAHYGLSRIRLGGGIKKVLREITLLE
ncbi:DUF4304 domain-containing protein [Proteus sp. GOKU]|jgi:hypothetical protein|uniref:DUF4304 domain-containing protein n=1 Tax=Proteus TaxID=583 RepID=UPI001892A9A6|nr:MULTISPECIES: DUF4304 domain-containing protein [Proteus]QPB79379.1 DUF4304 domain-containing protein [Proteus sp. GOKU]QQP25386.1 DUF4304 domain-containing protein [Proteus vulgaris]WPD00765.1 DUF4304 domain-containing protein [Proteus terrae]